MRWFGLLVVFVACVRSQAVQCGDRVCPAGTLCADVHGLCVAADQITACDRLGDGDVCTATSRAGICDTGFCIAGCGDGVQDPGEECDDGNFKNRDGCSSACLREFASWSEWQSPWTPRSAHAATYDVANKRLVMLFGVNDLGNVIGDQWTRDETRAWSSGQPAVPPRREAAIAYDVKRKRIVLFGGVPGGDETWEYDGATWAQRHPVLSPPARNGAGMVYDEVRERIVMFGGRGSGGYLGDTWEYDGATWTHVITVTAPGVRQWPAFAWDVARERAVLFGGFTNGPRPDTWEYANGTWTEITSATAPAGRWMASMAYHPTRGKVVLFGGQRSDVRGGDTWEFDGTWTPVARLYTPPARSEASLTYDFELGALVLIGGVDLDGVRHSDVWEYSAAGDWTNLTPEFSPRGPRQTAMAFDASTAQLLLYGGLVRHSVQPSDTWSFDGLAWTRVATTASPPGRYYHSMTYNTQRARVILFGGTSGGPDHFDDAWEWDGAAKTWSEAPTTGPSVRALSGLADQEDGSILLFGGGRADLPTERYSDTWRFDGATWTQLESELAPPAQFALMAFDSIGARTVLFAQDGVTWEHSAGAWRTLETIEAPPPRSNASMVFDPWRGRVVLYGGTAGAVGLDDMWELDGATWHRVPLYGLQPPARQHRSFAPLPTRRALVMFGGSGRDDTWVLRYTSDTPDEICDDGIDNDGDRHVDADDPDCTE